MSYSITTKFNVNGPATPLLPEDYIIGDLNNPITVEEGASATLKFKADGMYFVFQKRKGASATGATLTWNYISKTEAEITLTNIISNVEITIIAVVENAPQLVSKPFLYKIPTPVDTRLILTKKEMLDINDTYQPDVYFALCKDDGQFYLYNKSIESNEETGKFTLINKAVEVNIKGLDGGEII